MNQLPIQTTIPTPEEIEWVLEVRKSEKEQPKRIEEAAKFLSGVISITLSIFLQLNGEAFKGSNNISLLGIAILLWIVSLGATLFVITPFSYSSLKDVPKSIRSSFNETVGKKYFFLRVSIVAYFLALAMTGWVYYKKNVSSEKTKEQYSETIVQTIIVHYPEKNGKIDSIIIKRDTLKTPKK